LAPILFILYVTDLAALTEGHGLLLHQYADDVQIHTQKTQVLKTSI
jgi:hypothetical protein